MTDPSPPSRGPQAPQDDMFDGFRSVSMVFARFIHGITHNKRYYVMMKKALTAVRAGRIRFASRV